MNNYNFLSLPLEIHFSLLKYLNNDDLKSLSHVNTQTRRVFSAVIYRHIIVTPFAKINNPIFMPKTSVIPLNVFCNPDKFKWFPSWAVEKITLTERCFTDEKECQGFRIKMMLWTERQHYFPFFYPSVNSFSFKFSRNSTDLPAKHTQSNFIRKRHWILLLHGIGEIFKEVPNINLRLSVISDIQALKFLPITNLELDLCPLNKDGILNDWNYVDPVMVDIYQLLNVIPTFIHLKKLVFQPTVGLSKEYYDSLAMEIGALPSLKDVETRHFFTSGAPFYTIASVRHLGLKRNNQHLNRCAVVILGLLSFEQRMFRSDFPRMELPQVTSLTIKTNNQCKFLKELHTMRKEIREVLAGRLSLPKLTEYWDYIDTLSIFTDKKHEISLTPGIVNNITSLTYSCVDNVGIFFISKHLISLKNLKYLSLIFSKKWKTSEISTPVPCIKYDKNQQLVEEMMDLLKHYMFLEYEETGKVSSPYKLPSLLGTNQGGNEDTKHGNHHWVENCNDELYQNLCQFYKDVIELPENKRYKYHADLGKITELIHWPHRHFFQSFLTVEKQITSLKTDFDCLACSETDMATKMDYTYMLHSFWEIIYTNLLLLKKLEYVQLQVPDGHESIPPNFHGFSPLASPRFFMLTRTHPALKEIRLADVSHFYRSDKTVSKKLSRPFLNLKFNCEFGFGPYITRRRQGRVAEEGTSGTFFLRPAARYIIDVEGLRLNPTKSTWESCKDFINNENDQFLYRGPKESDFKRRASNYRNPEKIGLLKGYKNYQIEDNCGEENFGGWMEKWSEQQPSTIENEAVNGGDSDPKEKKCGYCENKETNKDKWEKIREKYSFLPMNGSIGT